MKSLLFSTTIFLLSLHSTFTADSGIQPYCVGCDETHLVVQNLAKEDIVTTIVTDVDEYDWDGNSGPQHNFEDIQIASGQLHQEKEMVNTYASNCPFSMILIFGDGTRDKFRINMKYANDKAQAAFEHLEGYRDIKYMRIGNDALLINVRDNDTVCSF